MGPPKPKRPLRGAVVLILLGAILVLSGATHLTNPVLAHAVIMDEGIYINRALRVLQGYPLQNPEGRYAHPFFGWVLMALVLPAMGYPPAPALGPGGPGCDPSCAMMVAPRDLTGMLAVGDTLLIYSIARRLYRSPWAGLAAAALFATTPATWFFSMVFLDSFMVFWFLLAMALLLGARDLPAGGRRLLLVGLSGIAAGLALITKLPAIFLFPAMVALLVPDARRGLGDLARALRRREPLPGGSPLGPLLLWLLAAALPPLAWALYATFRGELGLLLAGILDQNKRATLGDVAGSYGGDRLTLLLRYFTNPLNNYGFDLWHTDPLLLILGAAAVAFAFARREWVLVAWVVPYVAFLAYTLHKQFWFVEPLIPAMAIALGGMAWTLYRWAAGLPSSEGGPVAGGAGLAANGGPPGYRRPLIAALAVLTFAFLLLAQGAALAPYLTGDPALAQHQAVGFVLRNAPPGATVLSTAAFDWILHYYRPDLNPLNYYQNRFAELPLAHLGEPLAYTTVAVTDASGHLVYYGNSIPGLHTMALAPGSYTVVATRGSRSLGPFTVDLRGAERLTIHEPADRQAGAEATLTPLPQAGPLLQVAVVGDPQAYWIIVDPVLRWDATNLQAWLGGYDDASRPGALRLLPWAPALARALDLTEDRGVFAGNDPNGTFHLPLPPGRYVVAAWTKDHLFLGNYTLALEGPAMVELTPKGARVEGAADGGTTLRVVDQGGNPLPWAWIQVSRTHTLATFTSGDQTVEVRAFDPAEGSPGAGGADAPSRAGIPGGPSGAAGPALAGAKAAGPLPKDVIEQPFTTLYLAEGVPVRDLLPGLRGGKG